MKTNNCNIPQQINFTGKLREDDGATKFFIAQKQQKTILNVSLDSLIEIMEHQKILNLLYKANDYKFVTRKWNTLNDSSKVNYNVGKKLPII